MEKSLSSSSSTSSTKIKRSFYRRKVRYQEGIMEQSATSLPAATTLMPTYLSASIIRKTSSSKIASSDFGGLQMKQVEKKRKENDKLSYFLILWRSKYKISFLFLFFLCVYIIQIEFERLALCCWIEKKVFDVSSKSRMLKTYFLHLFKRSFNFSWHRRYV